MFNVDWHTRIRELLQFDARLTVWIEWIYVLIKPVRTIDGLFSQLRDEIFEFFRWNSLKFSLEKLLNDRYDPLLRRIEIVDVVKEPVLFYRSGNEEPEVYYTSGLETAEYFYSSGASNAPADTAGFEMKIRIHVSIPFVAEEVLELVDRYRYAGVRPQLFTYGVGIADDPVQTTFTYG